jgi:hypothetical protein
MQVDAIDGSLDYISKHLACDMRRFMGHPYIGRAIRIRSDQAGMRFEVPLVNGRYIECVLESTVGRRERAIEVAMHYQMFRNYVWNGRIHPQFSMHPERNRSHNLGGTVVNARGRVGESVHNVKNRGKFLVPDVNERKRLFRNLGRVRRNGGNLFAYETHDVSSQNRKV